MKVRIITLLTGAALALVAVVYVLSPEIRAEVGALLVLAARADIAPLRDYLLGVGWWAPVISGLLQIVTSIFAPLPSFVLAFVNAMLFGFWLGGLLTWTTALLAAAICFWIARTFGRPAVERFVPASAIESTDRFFDRHGALAVLIARIVPFINPDVVSYAAGLTAMRRRLFMFSIAAGSVPSTVVYSYLGSRGITTIGWLLIPLVVLGVLAFAGAILHRYRESLATPAVQPDRPQ